MRVARYFFVFLVAFVAVGILTGQGAILVYGPIIATPTPPSCAYTGFPFPQNATMTYTVECYDWTGHTSMNGGGVTGSGMGGCTGLTPPPSTIGHYCQASIYGPGMAPKFQGVGGGSGAYGNTWTVYIGADNVTLGGLPPVYYICGGESISYGPGVPVKVPYCYIHPKPPSPIVIDPTGEGFFMTDAAHGIKIRETATSPVQQVSWTDPNHHNAWLVKPNADGSVLSMADNMFGNLTPQPPSKNPNGYLALAYWMSQEGCGANLARLDSVSCPSVWNKLRLWQDVNQDGVAQSGELHTLTELGVWSIGLKFQESGQIDQYGNVFRYMAHIWDDTGVDKSNRTYDVFLVVN